MKPSAPANLFSIGKTLSNRYRLEAELGRGGTSIVYRAFDELLERNVALKLLSDGNLGTEGRARLLREAQAVARLNHPNIINVYDAGEADGLPYIIMELVEGRSLFENRPQTLDETLGIIEQVCAALQYAHEHNTVHRDLKPENVILAPDGTAKLTDFGLARSMASRFTTEGAIVGTVYYLAPEQALGQAISAATDLYSLGVMLYELAAGKLPFTADEPLAVISQHLYAPVTPPSTYNSGISPQLDALILQLMSKRPEDRPLSAVQVGLALRALRQPDGLSPADAVNLPVRFECSPLDRLVRGRLVGRDREFSEARALWTLAQGGQSQVLLLTGESGVGKTPLVREIRTQAEVSGARALVGECYAEGGAPYAPIAQIIREALATPRPSNMRLDTGQGRSAEQAEWPQMILADLITLAPDLSSRFPAIPTNPPLDPVAEQQRLFESVVALCSILSERRPLLLVVEDVQWADSGSLCLLRHLARRSRAAGLRLMIVLTYREVDLDENRKLNEVIIDLTRERLAARLKLARFDREGTRELLSSMLQEPVSDELLESIYRETEGNLFFIEEVVRALIEEGKLYCTEGRWQWASIDEIRVPQSVRSTIQARVAKLPETIQDVLRSAAIIGREFDFATLSKSVDLDEDDLIDALEAAVDAQIIRELKSRAGQERFAFTHNLIPSTLRDGLSSLRRRRLHRNVAAALEAQNPENYEVLAYHYAQAGNDEQALKFYTQAGDRARKVFANEEAIRFYTQALESAPQDPAVRFNLLASRASVYDLVARREAQRADIEAMLALANRLRDDVRRCDALIALAEFYIATDNLKIHEVAEQAVNLARQMGDPVREGRALHCLGYDSRYRREFKKGHHELQEAVARFKSAGQTSLAINSLHLISLLLTDLNDFPAALQAAEEAVRLSRQLGDRRQEAISLRRMAIIHNSQVHPEQAKPFAEAALALHRELGDRTEESHALNVLGMVYAWLDQPEAAEQHLRLAVEAGRSSGSHVGYLNAVGNLSLLHYRWQGLYESGLAFLEEELNHWQMPRDDYVIGMLQSYRLRLLSALGQYRRALTMLHSVLDMIEKYFGRGIIWAQVLAMIARHHAELGDYDQARRTLDTALAQVDMERVGYDAADLLLSIAYIALLEDGEENLRRGVEMGRRGLSLLGNTYYLGDVIIARSVVAGLYLALGQTEEALIESNEAVRLLDAYPCLKENEVTCYIHAAALRAAGRTAEADSALQRAYTRVTEVARLTQGETLRRGWLESVRFNRRIITEWAIRQGA